MTVAEIRARLAEFPNELEVLFVTCEGSFSDLMEAKIENYYKSSKQYLRLDLE